MAYNLYVKYKKAETPVLNISFSSDGSIHLIDLISKNVKSPEFEIATLDFPVNNVGMGKSVPIDKKIFYASHRLKFTHHQSGLFQVSGEDSSKIISGIDGQTGQPRGVAVKAFELKTATNDGGPFLTGHFWGLHHLPYISSKSSEPIVFSEEDINYQSMNDKGKKLSFSFLFFHLPISKFTSEDLKKDWVFYNYHHYKKPLLLRLLKESITHGYLVGVSCLKSRTDSDENFGYFLCGGAGRIDPTNGTCKNVVVIFPRSKTPNDLNYHSLNYQDPTLK